MSGFWNDETNARLRTLFEAGLSFARIAQVLGTTRSTVAGRVSRLGWKRGANPQRAPGAEKGDFANLSSKSGNVNRNRICQLTPDLSSKLVGATKPEKAPALSIAPEPVRRADGSFVTVADARPGECRWPIGEPGTPGFHFCGHKVEPGKPYCPHHCRVAYVPKKPRPVSGTWSYRPYLPFLKRGEE